MEDRILSHRRSEAGQWNAVYASTGAGARPFVRGPYVGWTESASVAVRRREVPIPYVPVIVNFADPFRISTPSHQPQSEPVSSFVAGAHDSHTVVESIGTICCMQANLTYDGAYRVLQLPMHVLSNRVVALEDLLGAQGRGLIEELGNTSDWLSRFDIFDRFLTTRMATAATVTRPVAIALAELERAAGSLDIGELARTAGMTRKRLIGEFRRQVGLTPKKVARLHRFSRAMALFRSASCDLAGTALEAGYCDQAHFNRDFRKFAGLSPTEYMAERLPGDSALAI